MTHSDYDSYRPPEPPRRRRRGGPKGGRRRGGGGDGAREQPMVPDAEFASYYDRPIVKPPPWENPIGVYLFLGGLAGGSAMLAAGAELTGNEVLRRNSRLSALGAVGLGAVALCAPGPMRGIGPKGGASAVVRATTNGRRPQARPSNCRQSGAGQARPRIT